MAEGDSKNPGEKDEGLHASDVPPPPVTPARPPEPRVPSPPEVETPVVEDEPADEEPDEDRPEDGSDQKLLGLLCHLLALVGCLVPLLGNIAAPLVLWVLKRKDSKMIEAEGRKSVNFQILFSAAVIVLWLPMAVAGAIPILGALVGFVCVMAIFVGVIANVVLVLLATMAVNGGKEFKYPLSIDVLGLIEKKLAK